MDTATSVARGKPLSAAHLIAKADDICKSIAGRRDLLNVATSNDLKLAVPQVAAYQQELASELQQLVPPAQLQGSWSRVLEAAQSMAQSTAQIDEDVRTNDFAAARPLYATFAKSRLELRAAAKRAGMRKCGVY